MRQPCFHFDYMGFRLRAPLSFIEASQEERDAVCNGVGAAWMGHRLRKMLDSTVVGYGVSFRPAADIHDWMYDKGEDIDDKHRADNLFRDNCFIIACSGVAGKWYGVPIRVLRERRALQFYAMVRAFGWAAFWANK